MTDKILAALGVLVIILGLLLALQGKTIKSLKGEVGRQKEELVEASERLDAMEASGAATVKALEEMSVAKGVLQLDQKKIGKQVEEVIKNGKASGDDITLQLSDSMWLVYCEGAPSGCSSKQSAK